MCAKKNVKTLVVNHIHFEESLLIDFYKNILKPRLIEEKMILLLRQGKISKWFSGIGQEAISVGVSMALTNNDYILPMHRNLGVFTTRQVPLYRLFAQWQGKASGFTKGRDRSFHFGSQEHKIIGMISHLGPQLGVADGIALASKLNKSKQVTAVFTGEGGTSEGDFHEALNVASVWQLPVLFCVENNGYGLSTPTNEQYYCNNIADRGAAYGMESHIVDGNNILEVYTKVSTLAKSLRAHPRPVLIEFKTFRMRGHEESSGTDYVPIELLEKWSKKDPLKHIENLLIANNIIDANTIEHLKTDISKHIEQQLHVAYNEPEITANATLELSNVFKEHHFKHIPKQAHTQSLRFIDAISQSLKQSMQTHHNLVLMGQDIADYGGVFKVTKGFLDAFGKERVRNTPICESAIIETAMGLSIAGMKAVVEMQFADFASSGFNPIVNYLAKSFYRWGENADVVIRMPCGAGVGAGPFHSQSNEAWFTKTPGLKVVYPAFPVDAKGLLAAAINDPNPVLFFEHKALYRTVKQDVPKNYYTTPLGKASLLKQGNHISVISYGAAVHWAIDILDKHNNIKADVIDLRTLCPLDMDTIYNSVKKTGKVIILQEDSMFGGIASDIAASIMEQCFNYLDAPVKRVAGLNTPIPFAKQLENEYLPKRRFEKELINLVNY